VLTNNRPVGPRAGTLLPAASATKTIGRDDPTRVGTGHEPAVRPARLERGCETFFELGSGQAGEANTFVPRGSAARESERRYGDI
jgi:hypothetical protein